jgi:pimeloyl-ACP methyl ester carboxylesterase
MTRVSPILFPIKFLLLAGSVFFLCCHNQITMPPCAVDQLARWFINPSPALSDSLYSYKFIENKLDSLLPAAKKENAGHCGTFTSICTDTFGAGYTIGWKTPVAIRFDTLYPLIIYLHGGTGTSKTNKGEIAYDMLSALADTFSLFMASPSANRDTPWWSAGGISRILQTVRFMTLRYPINPEKIFLAGVSDGATACYAAANTISSPFAGFIAVSGYGGMLFSLGMKLYPQNLMQRPIVNINAGLDHIYPIVEVRKFIAWLEQNGVSVEYREYPDEKHGFDYRAKEYGNIARFLRTWSRPTNVLSVSWTFVPGFPNNTDNCEQWTPIANTAEQTINGFWTKDTLRLKTKGLSSVVLSFGEIKNREAFISVNGSVVRKLSPAGLNGALELCGVLHSQFPQTVRDKINYRVDLRP